jgi:UDP-N-acetylglucosamine--N-acetylmuramyl-(pentapeptide) pyrophosphoryl-undecaprenol N-acetylglucosamine transferase
LTAQAMCLLKQDGVNDFFVIHQTGAADEATVRETYEKAGVPAFVSAFITEMGRAYASADLIIARAGASTCFELCLLGKPAFLIPLPTAIRDHQRLNAAALARTGGANIGTQHELTGRTIMRYILNKKNNPDALKQMSKALKTLSPQGAAGRVAEVIEEM